MCGISGWSLESRFAVNHELDLERLTTAQNHRGPDALGKFENLESTITLGHNRLSIIDLSDSATQPMYGDDGEALVFNGEIYNYLSLKNELTALGHVFTTKSDTEVLVKSFQHWGLGCLDRIKGMYSIAYWQPAQKTLHLVRDPMGIKPLYYWLLPEQKGLVFASEIRSFLALPDFQATMNKKALNQYLEFGYTFDRVETIFRNVYKVPPGHRLEVVNGKIEKQIQFYELPESEASLANSENSKALLEEQLYETLSTVVQEHLIADVPVGILLSGGLDSSVIASIASRTQQIHTFSMGFSNSLVDERPFARSVSEHIDSIHSEFLFEPKEIMSDLESMAGHFDDIFADWGMISTNLLYKKCKQKGLKVVVVGEGADELFGGYDVFRQGLLDNRKIPLEWRIFQLYRSYAGKRYGNQYFNFRSKIKSYMSRYNANLFDAIRYFESRDQLPNNYVMKVDKASMAESIEGRTPFLDSRIADIAYRIPRDMLINADDEKIFLRNMAKRYDLLPIEIYQRKKYGSGIASNWMDDSEQFRSYAKEQILTQDSWVHDLGYQDAMERYFNKGQTGYGFPKSISVFRNLAWRLLILNLWTKSLGLSFGNS